MGDKGFCSFYDVDRLREKGVDSVIPLARRIPKTEQSCIKKLAKNDLLIRWERPAWYKKAPLSNLGAELLFEVVSRAYERTSLVVTTNLPFESWTEVLGSQRLTGALLDRLTHRVHILEANGESFRLQDSLRRRGQRQKTKKP